MKLVADKATGYLSFTTTIIFLLTLLKCFKLLTNFPLLKTYLQITVLSIPHQLHEKHIYRRSLRRKLLHKSIGHSTTVFYVKGIQYWSQAAISSLEVCLETYL